LLTASLPYELWLVTGGVHGTESIPLEEYKNIPHGGSLTPAYSNKSIILGGFKENDEIKMAFGCGCGGRLAGAGEIMARSLSHTFRLFLFHFSSSFVSFFFVNYFFVQ